MVQTIEIKIASGCLLLYDAILIPEKNICYLNSKKYEIKETIVPRILKLLSYWKKEYGTVPGIDVQEFTITVTTKAEETKFHGKGSYPSNYQQLLDILGEIYD